MRTVQTSENFDQSELEKFTRLASRWWDPNSEFKPLHDINPLRLDFINQRSPLQGKRVLDVGCGYGETALELAKRCGQVVGIELSPRRVEKARQRAVELGLGNVDFQCMSVYDLSDASTFDLAVMDNVLEHFDNQPAALAKVASSLKTGGVLYLLVPNKLWPIEVHYRLPMLSYLPLSWANRYLRMSGRGTDYTDASYAPTYWRLKRLLRDQPGLKSRFVLPANLELTMSGAAWHYRWGAKAISVCPWLWAVSKAFLVVAVKDDRLTSRES